MFVTKPCCLLYCTVGPKLGKKVEGLKSDLHLGFGNGIDRAKLEPSSGSHGSHETRFDVGLFNLGSRLDNPSRGHALPIYRPTCCALQEMKKETIHYNIL